jgi:hypothetical protein
MRKEKLIAGDIVMLSPLDCGSIVGYTIRRDRQGVLGEIMLTDCNRKIEWYFSGRTDSLAKIDAAIGILARFRAQFEKAIKKRK